MRLTKIRVGVQKERKEPTSFLVTAGRSQESLWPIVLLSRWEWGHWVHVSSSRSQGFWGQSQVTAGLSHSAWLSVTWGPRNSGTPRPDSSLACSAAGGWGTDLPVDRGLHPSILASWTAPHPRKPLCVFLHKRQMMHFYTFIWNDMFIYIYMKYARGEKSTGSAPR